MADDADGGGVMDGALLDGTSAAKPDVLDAAEAASRARRAAVTIACHAVDVADCAELLAMLGLTLQDGLNRKARA